MIDWATMPLPPPITAAQVRKRMDQTGRGLAECKRELDHERLMALIQHHDLSRDPKVLTEILFGLAGEFPSSFPNTSVAACTAST